MKQWTKDDLTLFYYDELTQQQRQALTNAMAEDETLRLEYESLSTFLDTSVKLEVPQPDAQLNQRIMAAIYQQAELDQAEQDLQSKPATVKRRFSFNPFGNWHFPGALAGGLAVVLVTFYLGRMSVDVGPVTASVPQQEQSDDGSIETFGGKRVLLKNLSLHLQATDRLFTQVSNSDKRLALESENRKQMLEDMLMLNRIYRRMAESYQDRQLATVLQQMEQVLLSLKHTDHNQKDWDNLRNRIDSNDLLFRLRVTNRTLSTQSSSI